MSERFIWKTIGNGSLLIDRKAQQHYHRQESDYYPLKETSITHTDDLTGNKSSLQFETVELAEGSITLVKSNGVVLGGFRPKDD